MSITVTANPIGIAYLISVMGMDVAIVFEAPFVIVRALCLKLTTLIPIGVVY
jgi:hypothetical protein